MIEPSDSPPDIAQRERVERELLRQKTYLDELFELAPDAVALTTLGNARILRINREFTRVFGYTSEEAVGNCLRDLVVPDGLEPTLPEDSDLLAGRKVEREAIRRRKDGTRFHAHITGKRVQLSDEEDAAYVIFRDISARMQAEALFEGERRLLELIAAGGAFATTLDTLCRLAEDVERGSLTSILLLDRKRTQLRRGASPRLPPSYVDALDGARVGLGTGPCAAAAHLGEQVISLDLAADERWSDEIRALVSAHGLRTCWSTPIMSSDGRVLGTFAIYPSEPVNPTPEQRSRIEQITRLASIAIERAQSIEALHESEQRYQRAMLAAEAGFWDRDVPADELYVSPKLLEMTDLPAGTRFASRADFMARVPFHPDDRTKWMDAVNELFASGGTRLAMEIRTIHGDETRWALLSGICVRDAAGKILRWTGSATDVTARKRAEEALRESERRYERVMLASEAGLWDWDIVHDNYYLSPQMFALSGIPLDAKFRGREEFMQRAPFYPEDREKYQQAVRQLLAGGGTRLAMEVRLLVNSETRWFSMVGMCFRDEKGKAVRWTGSGANITEQKRAQEALRLSEERYALAMEASEEGHFDWNVQTDEVFASERVKQVLDLPADGEHRTRGDLMAAHIPFHPGDRERIEEMTRDVLGGDVLHHEFEYRLLRGQARELRWIHTRWKVFRNGAGVAQRVIGVVSDITERKRFERELRSRQEMLEVAQKAARATAFE